VASGYWNKNDKWPDDTRKKNTFNKISKKIRINYLNRFHIYHFLDLKDDNLFK